MTFIIFICDRIRHGQFPRLPDFAFNEAHGKYIYQGRELTVDEFNAAAEQVFSSAYRNQGFTFRPACVESIPVVAAPVVEVPEAPADEPVAEDVIADEPAAEEEAPRFTLNGYEVHEGETKIAIVDEFGSLKMAKGFSSIRADVEAWLKLQH